MKLHHSSIDGREFKLIFVDSRIFILYIQFPRHFDVITVFHFCHSLNEHNRQNWHGRFHLFIFPPLHSIICFVYFFFAKYFLCKWQVNVDKHKRNNQETMKIFFCFRSLHVVTREMHSFCSFLDEEMRYLKEKQMKITSK